MPTVGTQTGAGSSKHEARSLETDEGPCRRASDVPGDNRTIQETRPLAEMPAPTTRIPQKHRVRGPVERAEMTRYFV